MLENPTEVNVREVQIFIVIMAHLGIVIMAHLGIDITTYRQKTGLVMRQLTE